MDAPFESTADVLWQADPGAVAGASPSGFPKACKHATRSAAPSRWRDRPTRSGQTVALGTSSLPPERSSRRSSRTSRARPQHGRSGTEVGRAQSPGGSSGETPHGGRHGRRTRSSSCSLTTRSRHRPSPAGWLRAPERTSSTGCSPGSASSEGRSTARTASSPTASSKRPRPTPPPRRSTVPSAGARTSPDSASSSTPIGRPPLRRAAAAARRRARRPDRAAALDGVIDARDGERSPSAEHRPRDRRTYPGDRCAAAGRSDDLRHRPDRRVDRPLSRRARRATAAVPLAGGLRQRRRRSGEPSGRRHPISRCAKTPASSANALNSSAFPAGSKRNIVHCSPTPPAKRT